MSKRERVAIPPEARREVAMDIVWMIVMVEGEDILCSQSGVKCWIL
jgi:hypothetical protein